MQSVPKNLPKQLRASLSLDTAIEHVQMHRRLRTECGMGLWGGSECKSPAEGSVQMRKREREGGKGVKGGEE